jgi:hypothetical protein
MQAISASSERGGKTLTLTPPEPGMFHGPFAVEIESNTLKRYMDELAIPYFVEKNGGTRTQEELFAAANLYSQEAGMRADPRIVVFTNKDDFILQPSDLAWLEDVFAGRITVFPGGGHLGNMFMPQVQAAFMRARTSEAARRRAASRPFKPRAGRRGRRVEVPTACAAPAGTGQYPWGSSRSGAANAASSAP